MPTSSAYLFLELSILVFGVGFGWQHLRAKQLLSVPVLSAALFLAAIWFAAAAALALSAIVAVTIHL